MGTAAGISSIEQDQRGFPRRRPGRDAALFAFACLLAAGSALHGALYPRTFNGRPPVAIRSGPEPAAWSPPDAGPGAPSRRVALVVVDGLRDDAAGELGLEAATGRDGARPSFARCTLQVDWPSFSLPGYATIATGAPPSITGVLTDQFRGPVELDSVFNRAVQAGLSVCAVSDKNDDWEQLFPSDLVFQESGEDAFGRATTVLFAAGAPGCGLTLLHTLLVDDAGHAWGGASPAYARAVASIGARLRAAVARMDPERDTLIVTADHGHLDRGGHGGVEPEVVRVPLILVGRGARQGAPPGACDGRRLSDLAPTVAALLGVEPPRHAIGSAIRPLLALDAAALDASDAAVRRSRAALAAALGRAEGDVVAASEKTHGPALGRGLVGLAIAAGIAWLLLLTAGPAAESGRRSLLRCCLSAGAYPILAWSGLLLVGAGVSFSALRHGAGEYLLRLLPILTGAAVVGIGAHLLAFRNAPPDVVRRARAAALAAAAASWPIVVGLHGSPLGSHLGEPHLAFAVALSCCVTGMGCGCLGLILAVDLLLDWREARRAAARPVAAVAPGSILPAD